MCSPRRHAVIVSIRSPHGCKGRSLARAVEAHGEKFQSAPLTDVRGDLIREDCIEPVECFNPLPSRM